jgi:transposase, IS5 family
MRLADPQISFADLEFLSQGIQLDPVLQQILEFVTRNAALVETVRQQLDDGLKEPQTGRRGLTAEQTILSLILMRVKNWDYRELAERIADGYTLRQFTRFNSNPVPKHDAFNRAHNRLTPVILEKINELVVAAAVEAKLEDGNALRVDSTVVETNIHWPTDATLLWDAVRVLTRLIGRLREIAGKDVPRFPNRKRSARRRMQKLQRMTAAQREAQQVSTYRQLLAITQEVLGNARLSVDATARSGGKNLALALVIETLREEISVVCRLADQVVDQARRRVIYGEQVPTGDKIYSIFEPHTDLIKRGKTNKPIEFGHKVFLAESAHGLITQYRVLDGNPSDENHVPSSLDNHRNMFGSAPETYATDRGFHNSSNEKVCRDAGVTSPSIPQRGGQKTPERAATEKTPAFKHAQRFRAGIEGTISVLLRGRGMRRCLGRGKERFELLIGAAVLTNNLMRIARLLIDKKKPRSRAA